MMNEDIKAIKNLKNEIENLEIPNECEGDCLTYKELNLKLCDLMVEERDAQLNTTRMASSDFMFKMGEMEKASQRTSSHMDIVSNEYKRIFEKYNLIE